MKFKALGACVVFAQGLSLLALSAAHAAVILNYTGNNFTTFFAPYTGTDKVTATITLSNALPPNLALTPPGESNVTPLSFSLNDGQQVINNTNAISTEFIFATDMTGAITFWDIDAFIEPNRLISTINEGPGLQEDFGGMTISIFGLNFNTPGVWTATVTPEPSTISVLGAAVLALVSLWRRRSRS